MTHSMTAASWSRHDLSYLTENDDDVTLRRRVLIKTATGVAPARGRAGGENSNDCWADRNPAVSFGAGSPGCCHQRGTSDADEAMRRLAASERSFDPMLGYLRLKLGLEDVDGLRASMKSQHMGKSYQWIEERRYGPVPRRGLGLGIDPGVAS